MTQFSASPAVTASRTISSLTTGSVPCGEWQQAHPEADGCHTPRASGACKQTQHGSGTPIWGSGKRTATPPPECALAVHGDERWTCLVRMAAGNCNDIRRRATHWVCEADGADVGVGRRAIAVGAVAECFGVSRELYVRLDADGRQVLHLRTCAGSRPSVTQLAHIAVQHCMHSPEDAATVVLALPRSITRTIAGRWQLRIGFCWREPSCAIG